MTTPQITPYSSRVQSTCIYSNNDISYNSVYIPITNQNVSLEQANYETKLQYKGNILQYKGNSSRLTKNQKYTQIIKGLGSNKTKLFATQTQSYTNPNTTGLQRINYTTIPFPNEIIGQPNNISGPYQYNVTNPFDCSSNSIQEGGNLVCGIYVNPCSGIINKQTFSPSSTICNLSNCSNVPGKPIELCYNTKIQSLFPKQRYKMNNSTNKFPYGYK